MNSQAFYVVGITLVVMGLVRLYVERLPVGVQHVATPVLAIFLIFPIGTLFLRVWSARYAHDRVQRQIAKLLSAIGEVDEVAASWTRCRVGNPARLHQRRIRNLRSLLRKAVVSLPREITCLSGRGHQRADSVVGDQVKTSLLRALTDAPRPANGPARDELRKLLAVLSQAVLVADPHESLEIALRGFPATCAPGSEQLKTWSWQRYSLATPALLSVLAVPVTAFVVAKLANSSMPVGIVVAGIGTAVQTVIKYLKHRKSD
ncbi:hypothetical protein [Amycolatopsis ultiminotia]|uniref:hypothetical protein n=1 Tax=Amycolatopsis ultiminotia TaxID=543629 RepID=UPI0031F17BFA